MKIYTIDKDGYITGIKDVGSDCKINENDFVGEPPFEGGCHYETGLKRPISEDVLLENQKTELMNDILKAKVFQGTPQGDADLAELQQQYTDLCNGVPIVCKSELEAERDELISDVEMYLKALMA